jgi:hypothetical protein
MGKYKKGLPINISLKRKLYLWEVFFSLFDFLFIPTFRPISVFSIVEAC